MLSVLVLKVDPVFTKGADISGRCILQVTEWPSDQWTFRLVLSHVM